MIAFDPAKDAINVAKHGVSLAWAAQLEVKAIVQDGLLRLWRRSVQCIWPDRCVVYCLTYAAREGALRAIRLRRARDKEYRRYADSHPPPTPDDAAFDDPYNPQWTSADFAQARRPDQMTKAELNAFSRTGRLGRPPKATPKLHVNLRLDADIVRHFKAGGAGWQTRTSDLLRETGDKPQG